MIKKKIIKKVLQNDFHNVLKFIPIAEKIFFFSITIIGITYAKIVAAIMLNIKLKYGAPSITTLLSQ